MRECADLIWFQHPAQKWLDALPLGNGNLGGMVFADIATDIIAFGESTLWSGRYNPDVNPDGSDCLEEIRELIFAEKHREADVLIGEKLTVKKYEKPSDPTYGTHLPVGSLQVKLHEDENDVTDYCRKLDMSTGLITCDYTKDKITYHREYVCSNPAQVFAMKLSASEKNAVNAAISFINDAQNITIVKNEDCTLELRYQALEVVHSAGDVGVTANIVVKVSCDDGTVTYDNNQLQVCKASTLSIFMAMDTDFDNSPYIERSNSLAVQAVVKGYDAICKESIIDHSSLYNRMELVLGSNISEDTIPTDIRIKDFKEGCDDPTVINKFYQLARYLLIASSRENSKLPPSLQGNWTDNIASNMPWADDFHIDINTQQNYWHSETGNLSECNEPLFDFIDRIVEQGRIIAKTTYNCKGWCTHITINAWGNAPFNHGGCPTIGLWLISHLWEHYLYTEDKEFLKERAYPVLKEAAEFILDFLITDPETGYLVTNPGYSPENGFIDPVSKKRCIFTYGPAGDTVMITELFLSLIESCRILDIDHDFAITLQETMGKLPPLKIGKFGQLMEWIKEYEEEDPGHRHTQHLLSVYPYCQITPEKTPELAKAARTTISRRLETLFDTEWTRGNMMNFFARFGEGDHSWEQLRDQFNSWVIGDSMFTTSHNDDPPFVMDGNTSSAAGLAEMIIQSHDGIIKLLPAISTATETGYTKGFCARGGFVIDMAWSEGKITSLEITSKVGTPLVIATNKITKVINQQENVDFTVDGDYTTIQTVVGATYTILFS